MKTEKEVLELIELNKELLFACKWAQEQFYKIFEEGRYPKFMMANNGGEGIMPLIKTIIKAEGNINLKN